MGKNVKFFGIELDRMSSRSLNMRIEDILDGSSQTLIATPNPEMLMASLRSDQIADTLHRMGLRIPDGFGLSLMSRLTGQGRLTRHPGTDLLVDIAQMASTRGMKMLILGSTKKSADRAKQILETAFPGIVISTISDISISIKNDVWIQPDHLLGQITGLSPSIVAVALGSSDYNKQERWIVEHVPQFASVKLAIGVGGAIDMISGVTKRAPSFLRVVGLEWLWRLALQPSRIDRIITAVIRFPIAVIHDTIVNKKRI